MIVNGNIITADKGKVFRRIEDQRVYGSTIVLGYTYYIGDVKLDEPHLDTPEDFEEIDDERELTTEEALSIITGKDE